MNLISARRTDRTPYSSIISRCQVNERSDVQKVGKRKGIKFQTGVYQDKEKWKVWVYNGVIN